jgi:hypothetical protein
MARSLYDLTAEWDYVFRALEDEEADADEIIKSCGLIEEGITEKADNYGMVIRMLELEAGEAKSEAARLQARARTAENRAYRLRQALLETMKVTGQSKMRTPTFSFSVSPSPAQVRVTDLEAAINSGYLREPKMDESILDKTAMRRDLEAGLTIPGVELVRGESLRMR